jgi:hypothetical protein
MNKTLRLNLCHFVYKGDEIDLFFYPIPLATVGEEYTMSPVVEFHTFAPGIYGMT